MWLALRMYLDTSAGGGPLDTSKGLGATVNAMPWLALMWIGCYCLFKVERCSFL